MTMHACKKSKQKPRFPISIPSLKKPLLDLQLRDPSLRSAPATDALRREQGRELGVVGEDLDGDARGGGVEDDGEFHGLLGWAGDVVGDATVDVGV